MVKQAVESVQTLTPNIGEEQKERLKSLFPEVFSEGRIDFDKLRETLGELVDERPERYLFTWAGKKDAVRISQRPSSAALIPDRDESVDFDTTQNVFIDGENLEVLKLLYRAYFGRVKMIYIDPPYNTGRDFIYSDDFAQPLDAYLRLTGQKDVNGNALTSNPETGGRYHSSWLSMMYPRLFLARQLLADDGVIFVSIDDHEVHNLRMLMNEIFGEENFVAAIIWQKIFSPKNTARLFSADHDYILVYARNAITWAPRALPRTAEADARYKNPDNDSRGPWSSSDLTARNYYSEGIYEVVSPSGNKFKPSLGNYWRVKYEKFLEVDKDNRIWWGLDGNNMPRLKRFLSEVKQGIVPQTLWKHEEVGNTQEAKKELLEFVHFEDTDNVLDTVKPTRLIQRMLQIGTAPDENDIVLDFFAGSAATAHAVLKQNREDAGNRRFIMVQLPEPLEKPETKLKSISDIGKERIGNAIKALSSVNGQQYGFEADESPQDLGFKVFKLSESSYHQWEAILPETEPEEYARQMEMLNDPLRDGWKPEDVIYEVAQKEGFSLTSHVEKVEEIEDADVWRVTDGDKGQSFLICLDSTFSLETSKALNLSRDDLLICRDAALDDTTTANLALQCRLKTI